MRVVLRVAMAIVIFVATLFVADRAIGLVHGPVLKPVNALGLMSEVGPAGTYLQPGFRGRFRTGEYSIGIEINSRALRGPEIAAPKPAGIHRILALGDSFTFGQGVEHAEAWPEMVRLRLGSGVDVVNAGWSAVSPIGYERYLGSHGLALEPDIVLVALFVGNDIVDDLAERYAGPRPVDQIEFQSRYLTNLQVRYGPIGAIRQLIDEQLPNLYELGTVALVRAQYALGAHRPHFDYMLADEQPADLDEGWTLTLGALSSLRAMAEARGAAFGVVVIPFYDQVAPTAYGPGYTKDRPQQRIEAHCIEHGLRCLDLLPALRAAGPTAALYYLKDGHWTPRGHAAAADAIAAWLRATLGPGR